MRSGVPGNFRRTRRDAHNKILSDPFVKYSVALAGIPYKRTSLFIYFFGFDCKNSSFQRENAANFFSKVTTVPPVLLCDVSSTPPSF